MLKTVLHSPFREHLTCATSINAYVSQKLENIELDQKEKWDDNSYHLRFKKNSRVIPRVRSVSLGAIPN